MPTYDFLNKQTNEVEEHRMSYTVLDEFIQSNPHLQRYHSAENLPVFGDVGRMNVPRTKTADSAFEKGVIQRIKDTVPGKLPREW
jgi:hypothetical protein